MNFSSRKLEIANWLHRRPNESCNIEGGEKVHSTFIYSWCSHNEFAFISFHFNKHLANAFILYEYWPLIGGVKLRFFFCMWNSIKIKLNVDKQQRHCSKNYVIILVFAIFVHTLSAARVFAWHTRIVLYDDCFLIVAQNPSTQSAREKCYSYTF